MTGRAVGRQPELSVLERFLESTGDGFSLLALEGEPGIGKTTVWREGISCAEARGYHVLACRAAQSEARLSFVGLADLLGAVPEEALAALPEPQRRGLEVALLRKRPEGSRPDRRTISSGFLTVLKTLAAERGVLVALDDAQWLDRSTAAVLEFAARRLEREHVRMLASIRLSESPIATFDRVVGERRQALRIGPLTVGALHEMIKERLGHAFARPTLVKIAGVSRGNPLHALEIARALRLDEEPRPGEPLPVPDDVVKLMRSRIRRLPAESQEALRDVSALSVPTLALVDRKALAAAEEAEIIRISTDGRVEFSHPLFASAVYTSASAGSRRELHRRLARVVDEVEERARHLALAADRADEEVAEALEAGATSARARGAWESAAELLEIARQLTPPELLEASCRRGIDAADWYARAGDRARARALVEQVLAETPSGHLRARALYLLAEIAHNEASFPEALELLEEAARHDNDSQLGAQIELGISFVLANMWDSEGAVASARRALALAEGARDKVVIGQALAFSAMMDYLRGRGVDWDTVERSLEFDDVNGVLPMYARPGAVAGFLLLYTGRLSEARERLMAQRAWALEHGDESDLAFVLYWLAWLETLSGDYTAATAHADDAVLFATLTGAHSSLAWTYAMRGLLRAHKGELEESRADCERAATLAEQTGWATAVRWVAAAKCLLGLTAGDLEAVCLVAEPLTQAIEQHGIGEPVEVPFLPDALEALIALGQLDRASTLLDTFERRARALDRSWALATGWRCRGLLLAARGKLNLAEEAFEHALVEHRRMEMPFELARTLLSFGQLQRRRKQRKLARATLEKALDIFEKLGSPIWAERARADLERTHLRQAPDQLTPTELRVAELAAAGLTNREVAERLFLSPKTVEANLARAYRKLGLHSRAELGAALIEREPARSS